MGNFKGTGIFYVKGLVRATSAEKEKAFYQYLIPMNEKFMKQYWLYHGFPLMQPQIF